MPRNMTLQSNDLVHLTIHNGLILRGREVCSPQGTPLFTLQVAADQEWVAPVARRWDCFRLGYRRVGSERATWFHVSWLSPQVTHAVLLFFAQRSDWRWASVRKDLRRLLESWHVDLGVVGNE